MEANSTSRVRIVPCEIYPVGGGQSLIQSHVDGRRVLVSQGAADTIPLLRSFDTTSGHSARIAAILNGTGSAREAANQLLREIAFHNLWIREEQVVSTASKATSRGPQITTVGLMTSDRLSSCMEALESIAHSLQRWSRTTAIRVLDDTRCEDAQAAHRTALSRIAAQNGVEVWHSTRLQKARYSRALEHLGFSKEIVDFALLGGTNSTLNSIGANRNCFTLDTVGELTFSCDDDILFQSVAHPGVSSAVRLTGHGDPRDYWFYQSREELRSDLNWEERDILADHELLLGSRVSDLFQRVTDTGAILVERAEACDHMFADLLVGTARVPVTIGGVAGDLGGRTNSWLSRASLKTLQNCLKDADATNTALNSREVLGVSSASVVTHNSFCQTANVGFDNRTLLPPFTPLGRGEDTVFGSLVLTVCPGAYFGHVPYALYHNAKSHRRYEPRFEYRIAEVLANLINSCQCARGVPAEARFRQVGRHLTELAQLPVEEFWREVSGVICSQVAGWMRQAQTETLHPSGLLISVDWIRQLSSWYEHSVKQMQSDEAYLPSEFVAICTPGEAKSRMRSYVSCFGNLLYEWPAICAAATELKETGIRLSQRVA